MALSDEEQRLLEQLEAALSADDPKLANALRGTTTRQLHRRRALLAVLGLVAGVAALIAGMETTPLVSILGFLVMLVSGVVLLTSWQHVGEPASGQSAPPRPHTDTPFIDKIEERWRRNHDDGA